MTDADAALHHLFEANRLLREAGERLASTVGQTHARRMVLQTTGDGATVPAIARTLGLHRQGIQRITDELVAEGLGRYVDNTHHRRSKLFVLTEQGTTALSTIHRAHHTWVNRIEADTTDLDWAALHNALQHLLQVLQNQAAQSTRSTPTRSAPQASTPHTNQAAALQPSR